MKGLRANIIISSVIWAFATFLGFYFWLPAINLLDRSFWGFIIFSIMTFVVPFWAMNAKMGTRFGFKGMLFKGNKDKKNYADEKKTKIAIRITVAVIAIPVFVLLIGSLISSTVFRARQYASVITVNEATFSDDMPEVEQITNIALMDTDSARIIGNRALDKLSDVVSQFVAGDNYTQINYKGLPKKVTGLEYADFFKWLNNRSNGIPGYIMVDPVNNNAEYVKLAKPVKYAESGYFGDYIYRKLRMDYPTKIFDYLSYEIDESGNPYYIVSCVKPQIFPFGAYDVDEIIIFDPCTGDSRLIPVGEAPEWIDIAYSGDLAMQKYNWQGTLSGGFFNSIIGNKGCKMTTDDYGYIAIDDDVWYFTGVTSVTADSSNIGFILTNARTGQYKYYAIGGAEEHSAMNAAEGEVQEKGYEASFPSLVNICDEATYIMVLKDASGIVKLYALVNVENYNIVATGDTQDAVMKRYKELLVQKGEIEMPEPDTLTATVEVTGLRDTVIDGNTVIYITAADGFVYKGVLSENESLIFIGVGDTLTVEYSESATQGIREILGYKKEK